MVFTPFGQKSQAPCLCDFCVLAREMRAMYVCMYAWCVSPEIMAWCGLLKTLLEVFQGGDHEEVEISFGNMHDNLEEEEMLEFVTRLW